MDDSQAPVQTDEGQDEDTAVEVDGVDDMDCLAEELPSTSHSINRPEGKCEDKEGGPPQTGAVCTVRHAP